MGLNDNNSYPNHRGSVSSGSSIDVQEQDLRVGSVNNIVSEDEIADMASRWLPELESLRDISTDRMESEAEVEYINDAKTIWKQMENATNPQGNNSDNVEDRLNFLKRIIRQSVSQAIKVGVNPELLEMSVALSESVHSFHKNCAMLTVAIATDKYDTQLENIRGAMAIQQNFDVGMMNSEAARRASLVEMSQKANKLLEMDEEMHLKDVKGLMISSNKVNEILQEGHDASISQLGEELKKTSERITELEISKKQTISTLVGFGIPLLVIGIGVPMLMAAALKVAYIGIAKKSNQWAKNALQSKIAEMEKENRERVTETSKTRTKELSGILGKEDQIMGEKEYLKIAADNLKEVRQSQIKSTTPLKHEYLTSPNKGGAKLPGFGGNYLHRNTLMSSRNRSSGEGKSRNWK